MTAVTRQHRYSWERGSPREGLPGRNPAWPLARSTSTLYNRPREKRIDLVIGLDVVEFLLTAVCDVAITVSLDRDLCSIRPFPTFPA